MKKLIYVVITLIFSVLVTAFIKWNINIAEWTENERAATMSVFAGALIISFLGRAIIGIEECFK